MARARSIKPRFFQNEILADLPPYARLLFIGLWTIADRRGRLEDRPKRIKADIFPYEDVDINRLLQMLHEADFILRYESEGSKYIQVVKFEQHQKPHNRENESLIPSPPKKHDLGCAQARPKSGQAAPEPLTLNPVPLTGNREPLTLNPEPGTLNPEPRSRAPTKSVAFAEAARALAKVKSID